MKTLLALSLASVCGIAGAQTPASNPMPDGSRDLYVGVGLASTPVYPGASKRRVSAIPLLQLEFSNGVFISGYSAGMHLSTSPTVEYGPLLAMHPGRDQEGSSFASGVTEPASSPGRVKPQGGGTDFEMESHPPAAQQQIIEKVPSRLQGGMFANYYLSPELRLTSSLLYGAGEDRDGMLLNLGVQRIAAEVAPNHRLTVGFGLTMVNRALNTSLYGVSEEASPHIGFPPYATRGGVRDVSAAIGWNWALSPSWVLASSVRATRLQGDARHSPLVQRPTSISVSSGLAYRF